MLFVLILTAIVGYNGETARWLINRVHEHSVKDVNSHFFIHSIETNHPTVTTDDFRVLKTGYRQKKFRRKLSDALLISIRSPNTFVTFVL